MKTKDKRTVEFLVCFLVVVSSIIQVHVLDHKCLIGELALVEQLFVHLARVCYLVVERNQPLVLRGCVCVCVCVCACVFAQSGAIAYSMKSG